MRLRAAIGLLSGAAIAYQLLLMRLFSIIQWHHFAYMVISLALLGYGASGAFLTVLRRPLLERFEGAFITLAALFGLLAVGCYSLAQAVRLNPLEVLWDPLQLVALATVYLVLALPFFCAGSAIGLALARFEDSIHRIYRADLVGAAVGAMAAIGALYVWLPENALRMVCAAGALAALLAYAAAAERQERPKGWTPPSAFATAVLLLALLWPPSLLEPRISEYKALSKALAVPGAEVVASRSSPLGSLAAVSSSRIPFRVAPGLSLVHPGEVPEQILVFNDGDVATVVDRRDPAAGPPGYLRHLPGALPFELLAATRDSGAARVAILGAGSGQGLALALAYEIAEIHAVEMNPQLLGLATEELAAFGGYLHLDPRVRLRPVDPRGFLGSASEPFDLILMPAVGEGVASGSATSLRESYLQTVQALDLALERTGDDGLVAIEGELTAPLRPSLKLIATAVEALERRGLDPGQHLAVIRSWNRFGVVIQRSGFGWAETETLRSFATERAFDLAYYPGMDESEANRFHQLDGPELFSGIEALIGPTRATFIGDYKFDIRPATDDRPYFLHFSRWGTLGELARLRARGGAALVEWGYVVVIATIVQAALAGLLLILLPLWWVQRRAPTRGAGRVGLYFLCLGLGFLFLEIAFIQRLTLFLSHPLLAAGVVLAGFLFFAGLGSGLARPYEELVRRAPIRLVAGAIVVQAIVEIAALGTLAELGGSWPLGLKLTAALVAIAPLAFLLGMPFPLGLRRVAATRRELVPWAWGVNGWASVLAAVLATLVAVHFGFTAVVLSACALYALAAATRPRSEQPPDRLDRLAPPEGRVPATERVEHQ